MLCMLLYMRSILLRISQMERNDTPKSIVTVCKHSIQLSYWHVPCVHTKHILAKWHLKFCVLQNAECVFLFFFVILFDVPFECQNKKMYIFFIFLKFCVYLLWDHVQNVRSQADFGKRFFMCHIRLKCQVKELPWNFFFFTFRIFSCSFTFSITNNKYKTLEWITYSSWIKKKLCVWVNKITATLVFLLAKKNPSIYVEWKRTSFYFFLVCMSPHKYQNATARVILNAALFDLIIVFRL